MKKIIIFLFAALCINSYAQNGFPTGNAIWNEVNLYSYKFHLYGMTGDTVMNDTLYQKLYVLSDTTLDCINEQSECFGFIRQEEQKVFFKPNHEWEYPDILLYDFGASIGDTIWQGAEFDGEYFYYAGDYLYYVIENIEIENGRKIYFLEGVFGFDAWYENIGSYQGLFGHLANKVIGMPVPNVLLCFRHNDIVEFLSNSCVRCFSCKPSPIGVDEIRVENISIYPNPTTGVLNLIQETINNEQLTINNVEIFDMYGKKLSFNHLITSSSNHQINISHMSAGVYFVKIFTEKGVYIKKIIKT